MTEHAITKHTPATPARHRPPADPRRARPGRLVRALQLGDCPLCGKRRYRSRRAARRAARLLYPGDRLRAYRCCGYWHIGHLRTRPTGGDHGRAAR
jgi:hypothetical protein